MLAKAGVVRSINFLKVRAFATRLPVCALDTAATASTASALPSRRGAFFPILLATTAFAFGLSPGKADSSRLDEESMPRISLRPETKRFLHCLHASRDTRDAMRNTASELDPEGVLEKLEIQAHSGGIVDERILGLSRKKFEGQMENINKERPVLYKKEYQQQNIVGEPVGRNTEKKALEELYEAAECALPAFQNFLGQISDAVEGLSALPASDSDSKSKKENPIKPGTIVLAGIKGRERATEKAKDDYSKRIPGPGVTWLYDILRASILCDSVEQMKQVVEWIEKNAHIVKVKNRFHFPSASGYRDLIFHIRIPVQDHHHQGSFFHVVEVQVHHCDIKILDRTSGSHKVYEYFRTYFAGSDETVSNHLDELDRLTSGRNLDENFVAELLASSSPSDVKLLHQIAMLFLEKLGEIDLALSLLERILRIHDSAKGTGGNVLATIYNDIAVALDKKGDYNGAMMQYRRALDVQEEALGKGHPFTATTYNNLAGVLYNLGDNDGAMTQYKKALAIREATLGKEHPDTATTYSNIGLVLRTSGDMEGALIQYQKAVAIKEAVLGRDHPSTAATYISIGLVLTKLGDYDGALLQHQKALSICEAVLGKGHPQTAAAYNNIGLVLYKTGDHDGALMQYQKALQIAETVLGKDHPDTATTYHNIGKVLYKSRDSESALLYLKRAVAIREAVLGKDHPATISIYKAIAKVQSRKQ